MVRSPFCRKQLFRLYLLESNKILVIFGTLIDDGCVPNNLLFSCSGEYVTYPLLKPKTVKKHYMGCHSFISVHKQTSDVRTILATVSKLLTNSWSRLSTRLRSETGCGCTVLISQDFTPSKWSIISFFFSFSNLK